MFKSILTATFPPVAVCRYGCVSCCTLPIAAFWIGGLLLLGYYIFGGHDTVNELIRYGSLVTGLTMLMIAVLWAQSTIARVKQGQGSSGDRGTLCRPIPRASQKRPSVTTADDDPLAEVEKARKL